MEEAGTIRIQVKMIPGGKTWSTIFIALGLAFGIMFLCLSLGIHYLLTTGLFIATMILVIKYAIRVGTYTITDDGITEEIKRNTHSKKSVSVKSFPWSEIVSYKDRTDLSRSWTEKSILEIKTKTGYKMVIDSGFEMSTRTIFSQFSSAFYEKTEAYNAQHKGFETQFPSGHEAPNKIVRKKSFYEKPIAHVVFWALTLSFIGLMVLMAATHNFKWNYVIRLFIVFPGISYMYYRLYTKKPKR